eukprot:1783699-Amphidinium_carterae.1
MELAIRRSLQHTRGPGDPDDNDAIDPTATSMRAGDRIEDYGIGASSIPRTPAPGTPAITHSLPRTPAPVPGTHTTPRALGDLPSTPGRGPDVMQRVRRTFREEEAQTEGA